MEIYFVCTFWGCEKYGAEQFFEKALADGYHGIEINLPPLTSEFTRQFHTQLLRQRVANENFIFIPQQLVSPSRESLSSYINEMKMKLMELVAYSPTFINSQTGKDYFPFDDNCRVIEAALNISSKTGVRILHETHRGRFSFHTATLLPYLKKFPEMELAGDFSHFCTVSESMLHDQEEILSQIIPHVSHIHARVGNEQSPQVNDPTAKEWEEHFKIFAGWWKKIVSVKKQLGWKYYTITPEFGPAPYMPAEPFTQKPLSNQWDNNIYMVKKLKQLIG